MLNMSQTLFDETPPAEGHNSRHFDLDRDRRPKNIFGVSRDIFKHSYVGAGNAGREAWTKMEAWLCLCAKANYRPSQIDVRGDSVTLARGELVTTLSSLAEEWGWTIKQVRGFLDGLEHREMIGRKTGTPKGSHQTLLSISNYELYQFLENHLGVPKGNPKGTPKGNPRATQGQQSNKENKENTKNCGNEASPAAEGEQDTGRVITAYNAHARSLGWTEEFVTPPKKLGWLKSRIKALGGVENVLLALSTAPGDDYLRKLGSKMSLDYLLKTNGRDWLAHLLNKAKSSRGDTHQTDLMPDAGFRAWLEIPENRELKRAIGEAGARKVYDQTKGGHA